MKWSWSCNVLLTRWRTWSGRGQVAWYLPDEEHEVVVIRWRATYPMKNMKWSWSGGVVLTRWRTWSGREESAWLWPPKPGCFPERCTRSPRRGLCQALPHGALPSRENWPPSEQKQQSSILANHYQLYEQQQKQSPLLAIVFCIKTTGFRQSRNKNKKITSFIHFFLYKDNWLPSEQKQKQSPLLDIVFCIKTAGFCLNRNSHHF